MSVIHSRKFDPKGKELVSMEIFISYRPRPVRPPVQPKR
jgi:hypothetical protein